jgi:hypothetical protein
MSVSTIDYIPFDYRRYFQEILPAFEQACQSNSTPLKTLLNSATHIAFSLRTRYPIPLAGEESQHFLQNRSYPDVTSLLDVPTLCRAKAGDAWNPWEVFVVVLPTLEGRTLQTLGKYGELLRSLLLATLCCELPPWSANWPSQSSGAVIWHDEVMFDWHGYTTRDEQTQKLWGMFYQPLPQEITRQWPREENSQTDALAKNHPRAISYFLDAGISGFITHEEIEHLLQHVRTRERPEPQGSIISGCIRDGEAKGWSVEIEVLPPGVAKRQEELSDEEFSNRIAGGKYISHKDLFAYWKQTHPTEMEGFLQGYYQRSWMVEAEVLYRMRFAAARGWGMLKAYSN